MLICSNKYKEKDSSTLNLTVLVFDKEIHAIVSDPISLTIEAFDKVASPSDFSFENKYFSDVKVFVATSNFTLIPDAFFQTESIDSYLDFTSGSNESIEKSHSACANFNLHVVWGIETSLKQTLTQNWPGCSIDHLISKRLSQVNETANNNLLLIDSYPDLISILLFNENKLVLGNLYPSTSIEDNLYYSLLALERANIESSEVDVSINVKGENKSMLENYFPNLKEVNPKYKCSLNLNESDLSGLSIL